MSFIDRSLGKRDKEANDEGFKYYIVNNRSRTKYYHFSDLGESPRAEKRSIFVQFTRMSAQEFFPCYPVFSEGVL